MSTLTEGNLVFKFPERWRVTKLDEWSYYTNRFVTLSSGLQLTCAKCNATLKCQKCGTSKNVGVKAVDFLAMDTERTTWLIEVKDYRRFPRTKVLDFGSEIALKVRDTLAMIAAASINATDSSEKQFASKSLKSMRLRIVVHLEQPGVRSKLRPRIIEPAALVQKLKQLLKSIDPHPEVVGIGSLLQGTWSVSNNDNSVSSYDG